MQANNQTSAQTPVLHLAPNAQSQPLFGYGTDCAQVELLTQALKLNPVAPTISTDSQIFNFIESEHLTGLLQLADELDLSKQVDALIAQAPEAPQLTEFFSNILDKLSERVHSMVDSKLDTLVDELIAEFQGEGIDVDKGRLMNLWKACGKEFVSVDVSIDNSANTNFQDHDEFFLSMSSDNTHLTYLTTPTSDLGHSVMRVVQENSFSALLEGSIEGIFNQAMDFWPIYECGAKLFDERCLDEDKILETILADQYIEEHAHWVDSDDEEETKEAIENARNDIGRMVNIYKSGVLAGDTFLSLWFERAFIKDVKRLFHNGVELRSHDIPKHFITDSSDVIDSMNSSYDSISEECESRIKITPQHATDFLFAYTVNRHLVSLYEAIHTYGRESELCLESWLKVNSIDTSDTNTLI